MSTDDITAICWIDTETTGLDWTADLLEVGACASDLVGNPLPDTAELSLCVHHPRITQLDLAKLADGHHHKMAQTILETSPDSVEACYLRANDVVRRMHTDNGLWERCADPATSWPLDEVDQALQEMLASIAPSRQVTLGAATPKLDQEMLAVHLPKSYSHLHYQVIDSTALALSIQRAGGGARTVVEGDHTALSDALAAREEYRRSMAMLSAWHQDHASATAFRQAMAEIDQP